MRSSTPVETGVETSAEFTHQVNVPPQQYRRVELINEPVWVYDDKHIVTSSLAEMFRLLATCHCVMA